MARSYTLDLRRFVERLDCLDVLGRISPDGPALGTYSSVGRFRSVVSVGCRTRLFRDKDRSDMMAVEEASSTRDNEEG